MTPDFVLFEPAVDCARILNCGTCLDCFDLSFIEAINQSINIKPPFSLQSISPLRSKQWHPHLFPPSTFLQLQTDPSSPFPTRRPADCSSRTGNDKQPDVNQHSKCCSPAFPDHLPFHHPLSRSQRGINNQSTYRIPARDHLSETQRGIKTSTSKSTNQNSSSLQRRTRAPTSRRSRRWIAISPQESSQDAAAPTTSPATTGVQQASRPLCQSVRTAQRTSVT